MPARNPITGRADWIARTYPVSVLIGALTAWAEAVGDHALGKWLVSVQWQWTEPRVEFKGGIRLPEASMVLSRLANDLASRPALEHTKFDRYLPWVAKILNREQKRVMKDVRSFGRLMARRWAPGHFASAKPLAAQTGEELSRTKTIGDVVPIATGSYFMAFAGQHERHELMDILRAYSDFTRHAVQSFGSVATWADTTGRDLMPLSLDQAAANAQTWLAENQAATLATPGIVRFRWPDGWTVRELATKADFDFEGGVMGHCVDTYDPRTTGPHAKAYVRLFSLRDPKNLPHATMEWDNTENFVSQLRGKGNMMPKPEYVARIWEFRDAYFPPGAAAQPVKLSHGDPRLESPGFGGRFRLDLPDYLQPALIEFWDGDAFHTADVDEDLEERAAASSARKGKPLAEALYDLLVVHDYSPRNVWSPVQIPARYEQFLVERGVTMAEAEDELANAIRWHTGLEPTTEGELGPEFVR